MIPMVATPGGRSKVDLTLDLSSNDLRVAGAKAMASLLEMDTVRPAHKVGRVGGMYTVL